MICKFPAHWRYLKYSVSKRNAAEQNNYVHFNYTIQIDFQFHESHRGKSFAQFIPKTLAVVEGKCFSNLFTCTLILYGRWKRSWRTRESIFDKVIKITVNQRVQGTSSEQVNFRDLLLRLRIKAE